MRRRSYLVLALVLAGGLAASFQASPAAAGFKPSAFDGFCNRFPAECVRRGPVIKAINLDATHFSDMQAVNAAVNGSIRQVEDRGADVWQLPVNGTGDCEDLALLKRKKLIERGWPSSVLLMTIARDQAGAGHAVLTVATNKGNYVLDNRTSSIRLTTQTGYRFYSRQSASNPRVWVDIKRDGNPGQTSSLIDGEAAVPGVRAAQVRWAEQAVGAVQDFGSWFMPQLKTFADAKARNAAAGRLIAIAFE